MPRLVQKLACLTLLALSTQLSWGFAFLGPINEPYQVDVIGYNLPGDLGAPKNIGEAYRRNTPIMYYSFDANFLDYFGSNGVVAVESAIAVFNSLTNMSQLSTDLSEFPLQVTRENYLAEALNLTDIKSWTMNALCEQMGLAEPERYIWTLHDRYQPPGSPPCPANYEYLVIKRNFDPTISALNQIQASSYVNGTLYSFFISEVCQNRTPLAAAVPFPVDPLDASFSAVASLGPLYTIVAGNDVSLTASDGRFFTGLTRDDVGGLRYLYRTNLMSYESTGPNTLAAVTNPVPTILFTSNLTLFASQALTNDAATLQGLYPNLNIISSSNYFVNLVITNVTPYFTNFPWAPAGTTVLAFSTNLVPTIQTRYVHTFGNLELLGGTAAHPTLVPLVRLPVVNGKAFVTIETDTLGTATSPFSPAGSVTIVTNSTFSTFLTNAVVGDFVILPTNLCSVEVLGTQLTWVTTSTNFLGTATNSLVVTNASGFTNSGTILQISQSAIDYFTNHAFLILPVTCVASNVALFQGMDRIQFIRRDFDSLLGRFFTPLTNNYVLNAVTNSTLVPQPILRSITAPDFLFSAEDISSGPGAIPAAGILRRGINFNTNFENFNLAGPGTIESPTRIAFNKVGPIYLSLVPDALDPLSAEAAAFPVLILGSFDGTTNAPIVYPNGTSIENLENQVLIGISPGRLAKGTVGVQYGTGTTTFSATGGQPPYTWTLAPDSAGLPPGLHLLSDGTLYGTPTTEGVYDFAIRLTDATGRTVDRGYSLSILP